jgi:hypothetical protein
MTPERLDEIRVMAKAVVTPEAHKSVLGDLLAALDLLEKEADEGPIDPSVHADSGHPNFAAFVEALRGEARWIANLWRRSDPTGHSRSDADRLEALAEKIETFAKQTGYI